MIKDWFSNDYFDPFESEWENRPGKYKIDPNYMSMTLDDFITENKLGDDKNFKTYAAKHHIVPWSDGYDTKKLDQLLLTYKNILDYEAKRDAKAATKGGDEDDDDGYEEMSKNYPLIFGDNPAGPTGIKNPADYMSKITFEKDTDGDGDMDTKVTKVTDDED